MTTLEQLIRLHNLQEIEGETQVAFTIRQLSELEGEDVKSRTVAQINSLIGKYSDIFNITAKQAKSSKNSFTIGEQTYYLPMTFLNLSYGQWEDIQGIINREEIGGVVIKTNLEKLPFLLACILDTKYTNDVNEHQDILTDYKKYLEMNATEALAVWNFFISDDKVSTIISGYYSDIEKNQQKMVKLKTDMMKLKIRQLKAMTQSGVVTLSDVILLKSILLPQ